MSLTTFTQWLAERGARTRLGIYPPAYGSANYPPLYAAPTSATHLNAFAGIHGDEHPELVNPDIRKDKKKKSKKKTSS